MNAEQKKIALECIRLWGSEDLSDCAGDQMAALLQEMVEAPEPEPVLVVKVEPDYWHRGHYCEGSKPYINPLEVWKLPVGTKLYTAPPAPSVPETEPVARVTGYYAGYLSIATVDGRVLPTGTALYTAPPAPSVPDEELQAAFDRGLKAGNEQKEAQQVEIHRLHDLLAAAPTPAEAPADVARDAERLRLFEQWTEMGYEHTKEPWFEVETESDVIEITNDERNGAIVPIAEVSTGFNGRIGIEQEANARRIVACVNACAGIPTEVLEQMPVGPSALEQQRDKLLAALTEIAELDILKHHHAYAIAKGAIEEIEALK